MKKKKKIIWKEPLGRASRPYNPWRDAGKDYIFKRKTAEQVCKFIETEMCHNKGEFAGRPFMLERWERKLIGHLFGWKHRKTGLRRYRKFFLFLPRKNGKTQITSALGIIFLVADNEPGAEVYAAAADTQQASLVFDEAARIVGHNSNLSKLIKVFPGYKAMKCEVDSGYWRVLSSEAGTKHGLNPSAAIIDEVHAQKKTELMDVLETGMAARRQPIMVYISTADYAGDSPCNRLLDYARNVRDGQIKDQSFLPVIYEASDDEDDWKSEDLWREVNPNYGISIKPDYFRRQFKKALAEPSFENTFKRLHLNMTTEQEKRWMKMDDWDASGQQIDQCELEGQPCFAGIDLSSSIDISALVLYFPAQCACIPWFWVPAKTADKRIEYQMWAKEGYIKISKGRVIDYSLIRQQINECAKRFDLRDIAYDPYNASQLVKQLGDEDGLPVMEFMQTFKSISEPSKELEKLVISHKLIHFGNPVMRWMASNVNAIEDKNGNIKLAKPTKDSPLKVDGIIALVMAFGASLASETPGESYLDQDEKEFDKTMEEVYS